MNQKSLLNITDPDAEVRSMRIESTSIYPRTINDSAYGGACSIVLPSKGFITGDASIVLPAISSEAGYQYPVNVGVFSLIERARISSGGKIWDEVSPASELLSMLNMTVHPERKMNLHSVMNGINYAFETCSGSKLDSDSGNAEVLGGQYRLVADEYKLQFGGRIGRKNQTPYAMNGKQAVKLTTSAQTTPQYSIRLMDLFPGLWQDGTFLIPTGSLTEEVTIDLVFSKDGALDTNERAVFMPSLSTKTKDSIAQVAVSRNGYTGQAGDNATDVVLTTVKNARVLVDIVAGYTNNVRVIDGSRGFVANELVEFNRTTNALPTALQVMVGDEQFNAPTSYTNIAISAGGTGFVLNQEYIFTNTTGAVVYSMKLKATQVSNTGALQRAEPLLSENYALTQLSNKAFTFTPANATQATVYIVKAKVGVTTEQAGNAVKFNVGDIITKSPATADRAIVMEVSADANNNTITKIGLLVGSFAVGNFLDGAIAKAITAYGAEDSTFNSTSGLCLDPIYNFDDYDAGGNPTNSQKIKIDTPNVYLQVDIIYYLDGTTKSLQEKMMSPQGLPHTYTSFINTTSSIATGADVSSYGQTDVVTENRLIGLSNSTVRNLMWYVYNSGNQSNVKFPYYGKPKNRLPLLNKYHARSSLAMGGNRYNMNINSIPYYSNEVDDDMRAYTELSKCKGQFYVNKAQYMGWTACRQLDNYTGIIDDANPSKQPGFCDLDDATEPTLQYQINPRKAGITNQSYEGVDQSFMNGMACYHGVNFMLSSANVMGNGMAVGSTPVDMNLEMTNTYNPFYSGSGTLTLFADLERRLIFQNGQVVLQTASF